MGDFKEKILKFISSETNLFISSKVFTIVISFVGLFLFSMGVSVLVFSLVLKKPSLPASPKEVEQKRSRINLNLPKSEECPINGLKYTKDERNIWETRRPITAMIENHIDSRPQSGLSKADIIYEAVAEGGITRFLPVFYCGASAEDVRIGPIRSVRVYFINWAMEYSAPLFVHSGGANNICSNCPGGVKPRGSVASDVDAFRMLADIGWRYAKGNSMDAGTNIGFPIVWRDYERIPGAATEHTFMGSTDKLFEEGANRGFGYQDEKGNPWTEKFQAWKFADDKTVTDSSINEISFEFWANKPEYDVKWIYDKAQNQYLRFNNNKEHLDMDTKKQLSAKNIAVQFVKERGPVDNEGHMFYTTTGTGKALIFQNGTVVKGTWEKNSKNGRTLFLDEKGKEIAFVRGTIWIEALPAGNEVKY